MKDSMKTSVEYLDWYFTCDDGMADKDAQKAWFELRGEFGKMDKKEIIRRLNKIAEHAIHTVGEPPFIIGLDDGTALKEAVRMLEEREKVIKGLESQLDDLLKYADADEVLTLTQNQAKDILALLEEKEPVLSHEDADGVPHCGSCGWVQSWGCNYCDHCGKPLRWE